MRNRSALKTNWVLSKGVSLRLPDFLIIGAAKSGTSSLHGYLRRHPGIFMSSIKEPEFFARDEIFARGVNWYGQLFEAATADQLCGESSTAYTRWPQVPHAAKRMAQVLPDAKLIYIMRHPVDRAYSHYVHRRTKELYKGLPIDVCFEDHVRTDPMCLDGSDYFRQIEQYLDHYPRESFLFLFSDELRRDPQSVLQKVCRFVGLGEQHNLLADGSLVLAQTERYCNRVARNHIVAPLKAIPNIRVMARRLPRCFRDAAFRVLRKTHFGRQVDGRYTPPPLSTETRRALTQRYFESNRKLEILLGKDLSHWDC